MIHATDRWVHEDEDSDCYICNCSNKVHFFFRRQHVKDEFQTIVNKKTIEILTDYFKLKKYKKLNPNTPMIFGSITDWHPVKMMSALDHTLLRLSK